MCVAINLAESIQQSVAKTVFLGKVHENIKYHFCEITQYICYLVWQAFDRNKGKTSVSRITTSKIEVDKHSKQKLLNNLYCLQQESQQYNIFKYISIITWNLTWNISINVKRETLLKTFSNFTKAIIWHALSTGYTNNIHALFHV